MNGGVRDTLVRPKTARPLDNSLKFSKFAGVVQARSEASGKKKWVHFRWAGQVSAAKFPRMGGAFGYSVWARAYYQQERQRGSDHHAAVRALAFKWIRILFRCWKDRVAYDENKYLAALAKRGSPLNLVLPAATATV